MTPSAAVARTRNNVSPLNRPIVKPSSVFSPCSDGSDVTRSTNIASRPPTPPINAPVARPPTTPADTRLADASRSCCQVVCDGASITAISPWPTATRARRDAASILIDDARARSGDASMRNFARGIRIVTSGVSATTDAVRGPPSSSAMLAEEVAGLRGVRTRGCE